MRRFLLATPALCTAIALTFAGMDGVRAQNPPPPYQATPLENEAIREYTANHLITARARAWRSSGSASTGVASAGGASTFFDRSIPAASAR